MNLETLTAFFGWCTVINFGLLLWWFLFIALAHDFTYRLHSKWLKLSVERFDTIHYAGMAYFKLTVFIFNLAPYLALRIIA